MENISRSREMAKRSLFFETNNKKQICETLRLIYDEIEKLKDNSNFVDPLGEMEKIEKITEFLIDAMEMAKKMQYRLSYYQKTYKDNTGNKAINIIGLTGVKERSQMRRA